MLVSVLSLGPSMKERLFQWFILILVIASVVGGEKSNPNDDEEDSYDLKTNDVDEHDDVTKRMMQLINNAAMKIVEAPDLSKVIILFHFIFMQSLF